MKKTTDYNITVTILYHPFPMIIGSYSIVYLMEKTSRFPVKIFPAIQLPVQMAINWVVFYLHHMVGQIYPNESLL